MKYFVSDFLCNKISRMEGHYVLQHQNMEQEIRQEMRNVI